MKICRFLLFFFSCWLGMCSLASGAFPWSDLLDKVYEESQDHEFASDKDAVDLFKTTIWIDIDLWPDKDKKLKDRFSFWLWWSVIARTTWFLLRVVVILAIPMLLVAGIRVILSRGDEWKMTEALKTAGYVVLWIFLALSSILIVYLIISLTRSNLDVI